MSKSKTITVENFEIVIYSKEKEDYISLTDMARYRDKERTNYIIQNWLRTRNAIEFCGLWELMYNPSFKSIEFDAFKNQAGLNSFALTPQRWIENTNAVGIISKSGRYGGTFAHKDIAFEFASWISPWFKFYLIKEFQRLKEEENSRLNIGWNIQRTLAKVNYRIHTDAIKESIIPQLLTKKDTALVYSSEADMLNMAMFGKTAQQYKTANPTAEGNLRDEASIEQLVVLSNLESINAVFIHQGALQGEHLLKLNAIAITQMKSLVNNAAIQKIK